MQSQWLQQHARVRRLLDCWLACLLVIVMLDNHAVCNGSASSQVSASRRVRTLMRGVDDFFR
jgi:hypothetical protein